MALSARQLTPSYTQRYTDIAGAPEGQFNVGMVRDLPTWTLPQGASYDLSDFLCDRPGVIRQRGGFSSPAAGNSTGTVENLVAFKSGDIDAITAVCGSLGKTGFSVRSFATATGASTSVSLLVRLRRSRVLGSSTPTSWSSRSLPSA